VVVLEAGPVTDVVGHVCRPDCIFCGLCQGKN
jgi:hypothetical protein